MQKAVNNLTDAQIILGGVEIDPKSQRVVRQTLISEDEKRAVIDSGAVITFASHAITVAVKKADENKDALANSNPEVKASGDDEVKAKETEETKTEVVTSSDTQNDVDKFTHLDVAYPEEVIKKDGGVTGSVAHKATVAELQEKYGETILDDNAFKAKYPEADIDTYRVKVGA